MFIFNWKDINNKTMKKITVKEKMNIQLWLGVILAIVGVVLLWVGLFLPPTGVIDASVLTALGEVFTFSGSLIGIDYTYKYKTIKYLSNDKTKDEEEIEEE